MKSTLKPVDEKERLAALKRYQILDTLPEQAYDDIAFLASQICQTPIALVTFLDEERQWFKAKIGIDGPQTKREDSFTGHAVMQSENRFTIPDCTKDDRFAKNLYVTGHPHLNFYCGIILRSPEGYAIGTLSVIDKKARELTPAQLLALEGLARQVMSLLELRLAKFNQDHLQNELAVAHHAVQTSQRAKGQFLANMSHEIRTPMNGIIGLTELLKSTKLDPNQLEKFTMIQTCGQNLLELLNEILDYSKLEAGKVQIDKKHFNFREFLDDTMKVCENLAKNKNLELSWEMEQVTPQFIFSDAGRLRQIVMNLMSNALKFTAVGKIKLQVKRLGDAKDKNAEIQISVQDTGVGILPELQHRLFRSFSQADTSTTRRFGGTGLGLAICKGLCEKLDGRIWFETVPEKGLTFHFTFRAETSMASDCAVPLAPLKSKKADLKILVIEDNKINQIVIVGLLSQFGYDVDVANDGMEALTMFQKTSYDVAFLDCHMPRLDGFEMTKILLKDTQRYGRPLIVALTASVLEEDKNRCFECGMDEFLNKPVRPNDLKRILDSVQRKRPQPRPTGPT